MSDLESFDDVDDDDDDVTILSQNKLAGIQAKLTLKQLFYFFFVFATISFILGVYIFIHDYYMFELKIDYDSVDLNTVSELNFAIPKLVKKPVYVMYEIKDFFQAHQRFVTFRNNDQLSGEKISRNDIESCNPISTLKIEIPCGIAANTRFNDSFKIKKKDQKKNIDLEEDIVFKSDKKIFKNQEASEINTSDPHFIVWAKPSPFPQFRKTYGVILDDLTAGDYILEVDRQFGYGKNKKVILTRRSATGGKNLSMAIIFLVIFIISTILAVIYWFLSFVLGKE